MKKEYSEVLKVFRFLFFIFLIAIILAIILRWFIPIALYAKKVENRKFEDFNKHMEKKSKKSKKKEK